MLNVSGCGSHWHKPPLTEMAICDNFDIHYHIANHNHHKLATTIRKRLKWTELWPRQCREDFHLYKNFRQYILEAREIVKKRKAKLARLRAKRNRRTAKHHEKTIKTLKCPRCGTTLVCPSCGCSRKMR